MYKCRHEGCPHMYINDSSLHEHEQKPHYKCPKCGRLFISVIKHLSQLEKRGNSCVPTFKSEGMLEGVIQ